ncbi:MAG: hypothetical protein H7259_06085 [Cytophagales bacterium]|nr:hypothetical protein [Cytophaga sp.]
MKTTKSIIFSLLLLACTAAGIQAQTSAEYNTQKVSDKGIWTNVDRKKLGSIDSAGVLKDSNDVALGRIEHNPKNPGIYEFKDINGHLLATVLEDGTVRDLKGKVMYSVYAPDENGYCEVIGEAGRLKGMVHLNYKHSGVCLMQVRKTADGYHVAYHEKP